MSITIYKSQTVNEGAEAVLSTLKSNTTNRRCIVIVPDAFTLSLETGVLAYLEKSGTFNIEVMSFARLAAVALGAGIKKCLSPSGCVMLMQKVVSANLQSLIGYSGVAHKQGFASEVYAAITSVRNSGVSPSALKALVPNLSGSVKNKTFDLALLYEAYIAELSLNHTDSTTRLEAFCDMLDADCEYTDADYYIFDYCDFNAKQVQIIAALAARAHSVTVACAVPSAADNKRIYPIAFNKVQTACARQGIAANIIEVPCALCDTKRAVAEQIFSYNNYRYQGKETSNLTIYEAADITEEVTYIACTIAKAVREEGLRYRDFAVLAPEGSRYLPYLEKVFTAFELPYFADDRRLLSEEPVFTHLLAALELRSGNLSREDVEKYILHPLFCVGEGEEGKYAFLDYTHKYGVNYSKYATQFGYGVEGEAEIAERVRRAFFNEADDILHLPQNATVATYVNALLQLWQKVNLDEKVANYSKMLYDGGNKKQSDCAKQSPIRIAELLDTIAELMGEEQVAIADFIALLKAGAQQVKIATIPVSADCVYFADIKQAMYSDINTVFVIGASAGKFPVEETASGIIGEREYTEWQRHNVVIEQTGVEKLGQGKFHALQILLRGKRLYIGSAALPASEVIGQLRYLFSLPTIKVSNVLTIGNEGSFTVAELVPTEGAGRLQLASLAAKYRANTIGKAECALAVSLANHFNAEFPPKPLQNANFLQEGKSCLFPKNATSISRLESYFKCPYKYFVQYGLMAQRVKDGKIDTEVGTIVHECLKMCFTPQSNKMQKPDVDKIIGELINTPKYKYVVEAGGEPVRLRIVRECKAAVKAMQEFAEQTRFVVKATEQGFGKDEPNSYLPVQLPCGVKINGIIDRLDVLEGTKDAMVIDYKTYAKESGFTDVYYGIDLQLAIYLAAITANNYNAVAAFYARFDSKYTDKEMKLFSGQMLANSKLCHALDSVLAEREGEGKYTPLQAEMNANGELAVKQNDKFLLSQEDMDAMIAYAIKVADNAVDEIKQGFIGAVPLVNSNYNACTQCDFGCICGRKGKVKRGTQSKSVADFTKAVGGK